MKKLVKYQTTSYKIKQLFIELLKSKPIEQIKISEICEILQINRSTFYRHYEDIYDLLNRLEDGFINELDNLYREIARGNDNSIVVMKKILQLIKANKDICSILFVYRSDNNLWIKFNKLSVDLFMLKIYEKYPNSIMANQKELRESVEFVCSGFYALYRNWLMDDCNEGIEIVAKRLAGLSDVCVERALKAE